MELRTFDNTTGEGVVAFEPWQVSGPEYEADKQRWYAHVRVRGERVFEYGCPCGTCGILFRKVSAVQERLSDAQAVELLGTLETIPADRTLRKLARVLEPGLYRPLCIEAPVRFVEPGSSDDYFASEVVRLFGLDPPEYARPGSPGTPYWRLGSSRSLTRTRPSTGRYEAMLTSVALPLHEPSRLDRARVEHWKREAAQGRRPTAFALSVLDRQSPALEVDCPYEEQFLLAHVILDGHHRIQAAAELGVPIRILSLWSEANSLARVEELCEILPRLGIAV